MKLQKTIKSECRIAGKGLFGGADARVVFRPAAVDTGIVFVRTDVPEPSHGAKERPSKHRNGGALFGCNQRVGDR